MKLKELLKDIQYKRIEGSQDKDVLSLYYDSRRVTDKSLFVCIKGLKFDGHNFVEEAVNRGAHAIVLEDDVDVPVSVTKIFVDNSRIAMALISKRFFNNPTADMKLIGVTGTNGKTTVTYLLKSILEYCGEKVGLIGTITNMIGDKVIPAERTTPESLDLQKLFREMADTGVNTVVMEVSSHSLSLDRVAGCEFDVGIFTNLTQDHIDFHGTLDNYRDAKAKLFTISKSSIINVDDEAGRTILKGINNSNTLSYGIKRGAQAFARNLEITANGVSFDVNINNESVHINLGIPGIFSVYNALSAACACYVLGIDLDKIKNGLEGVKGVPGRFEKLDTGTDYTVILDYAHTPDGLENILKTASGITTGRIITMFGCGGDRDPIKRPIMGEIAGNFSDFCVVTSDNPRSEEPMNIINDILPGIKKTSCPFKVIEDRTEAIRYALEIANTDDVVILAGKGHETYQILKDKTIHFDEKEIVARILGREKV